MFLKINVRGELTFILRHIFAQPMLTSLILSMYSQKVKQNFAFSLTNIFLFLMQTAENKCFEKFILTIALLFAMMQSKSNV